MYMFYSISVTSDLAEDFFLQKKCNIGLKKHRFFVNYDLLNLDFCQLPLRGHFQDCNGFSLRIYFYILPSNYVSVHVYL